MSLKLHTIKPAKGATKKRKRIGRGNSSGHGTYSGRGQKGQKSRSGVSGLKRLGMRQMLQQIPKKRGFKSSKPKNQIVNINNINSNFKDNDEISPKILLKIGLIGKIQLPVKILGESELKIKGLKFKDVKISKSVKKQIEKMDGKLEVTCLRRQARTGKQKSKK